MTNPPSKAVASGVTPHSDDPRRGLSNDALQQAYRDHLVFTLGRTPEQATEHDRYAAAAFAVRDRLLDRWTRTVETWVGARARKVAYLSAEFLLGPHLGNNLLNLGILERVEEGLAGLGLSLDDLLELEEEPGLGNGGLGRLAACYLESLATLEVPAVGYGIRYEFGIFDQEIRDGRQVEVTDRWLRNGNPWELVRHDVVMSVPLGGRVEHDRDERGRFRARWVPDRIVNGVAYDTPVQGYRVGTCNTLRLWKAEPFHGFDLQAFNRGDYWGAVEERVASGTLSKVLYPNDEPEQGKRLRLEQQFFFTSCSLQDLIRLHRLLGQPLESFHEHFAVQLNDTHPSIGVAELVRLLVDVHGMDWEPAFEITRQTFGYTNHTLLPEALETWPLALFASVLPRHLEIIFEINRRFLDEVRSRFPGDDARASRMSLIDEAGGKRVRMAHLATVGSHTVNGVAKLHSELLRKSVLRDFADMWPEKFENVTNGVTPRRFVALANGCLRRLLEAKIGSGWIRDLEELGRLEPLADDPEFQDTWRDTKRAAKERLAARIREHTGIAVDPESMFDVQVKRIHEYKRQHLNLLHVITHWQRLRARPGVEAAPRTVVFGGKAAPGYHMAKLVIELAVAVSKVLESDPLTRDRLRVVFFPDLNVKNGQFIYPAADLSEQISLAGKEASGTGNMKLTLNGALTIGTLDGANVEIREAVGAENFFLFGMTADEVVARRAAGHFPGEIVAADAELRAALDAIGDGTFSGGDRSRFAPLVDALLGADEYLALADYRSYVDCQGEVDRAFRDRSRWTRASILNVARAGGFSSDRSVREYCERIWRAVPVPVGE